MSDLIQFQKRIAIWMRETLPEAVGLTHERGLRFIEEAVELVQAIGLSDADVHRVVDYVYGRPIGSAWQEVGGTMVTLAALCEAAAVDLDAAAMGEAQRIELPEIRLKVQRRQAEKRRVLGLTKDGL